MIATVDLYHDTWYINQMDVTEQRRVLETICGTVMGKYLDDGKYRLWIGVFNPNEYCKRVSSVGVASYFTVDDTNEDRSITTAYHRLRSAMVHQVKIVLDKN